MKNLFLSLVLAFSGSIILSGCNNDEGITQQEFLSASVDGEKIMVEGSNPLVKCQKRITEYGAINLSVKVQTEAGKSIEFSVLNYNGVRIYPVGTTSSFGNTNWMNYAETYPEGFWSTKNKNLISDSDFLEITGDDGIYLSGSFSFVAFDNVGTSLRSVSEGKFKIKIDR